MAKQELPKAVMQPVIKNNPNAPLYHPLEKVDAQLRGMIGILTILEQRTNNANDAVQAMRHDPNQCSIEVVDDIIYNFEDVKMFYSEFNKLNTKLQQNIDELRMLEERKAEGEKE